MTRKNKIAGGVILVALLLLIYSWIPRSIPLPDPALNVPFAIHASPRDGGLRRDDESFWGGSGVKGPDGRYHLFASRMGGGCGLESWKLNSEVVRATSSNPLGPYVVEETVLPAMAHNPTVVQASDGQYYLYYIGAEVPEERQATDCEGGKTIALPGDASEQGSPWTCSINVVSSNSPLGPWSEPVRLTSARDRFPHCATNPAPVLDSDGSLRLYHRAYRWLRRGRYRDTGEWDSPAPDRWLHLAEGPAPGGPVERFTPTTILPAAAEDPFVWQDGDGWHMLFNNKFNHREENGGYAYSDDGYQFTRGNAAYNKELRFTDGTVSRAARRERPQILWLEENRGVLFTGVRPSRDDDRVYTLATPIGDWGDSESQQSIHDQELDDTLRLNELQIIGSHNSYKLPIDPMVFAALSKIESERMRTLEYDHESLTRQLDRGLRSFEIDVVYDPDGGRFAEPAMQSLASSAFDSKELMHAGFKVLHVQDIDYRSNCVTLELCLAEIRNWSAAHPDHVPLIVSMNFKHGPPLVPGGATAPDFSTQIAARLDRVLRQETGADRLFTPDELRGDYATLPERLAAEGWPTLGSLRGRVIFVFDAGKTMRDIYLSNKPNLEGKIMFVTLPPGHPGSAIVFKNDPLRSADDIRTLVEQGYIVRTRSDAETVEARQTDSSRRDRAFASGAQLVSTDYYPGRNRFGNDYAVVFPGNRYVRKRPESGDSP